MITSKYINVINTVLLFIIILVLVIGVTSLIVSVPKKITHVKYINTSDTIKKPLYFTVDDVRPYVWELDNPDYHIRSGDKGYAIKVRANIPYPPQIFYIHIFNYMLNSQIISFRDHLGEALIPIRDDVNKHVNGAVWVNPPPNIQTFNLLIRTKNDQDILDNNKNNLIDVVGLLPPNFNGIYR